jgi:hypothetical protein
MSTIIIKKASAAAPAAAAPPKRVVPLAELPDLRVYEVQCYGRRTCQAEFYTASGRMLKQHWTELHEYGAVNYPAPNPAKLERAEFYLRLPESGRHVLARPTSAPIKTVKLVWNIKLKK